MTRGRVRDKTYTGHNGVATDVLRALDKLAKTPAGQFGRTSAPWREQVLACIKAGTCPWCDRGPFKVLATHTRNAHAVTGAELRAAAGLTKYASICDPSHSADCADKRRGERLPDSAYDLTRHKKRAYSPAGLDAQRAKLKAARELHPGGPIEQVRAASRASAQKTLARNREKYVEAARLFGEGMLIADIASVVGLNKRSIPRALAQMGIDLGDGRAARSRNPEFRERQEARRRKALASQAERRATQAVERLARFEALGGTWDAVGMCATEWLVSRKTAAGYLRKHGAAVPDGRG